MRQMIHRLSSYRHVLLKLRTLGFRRVFSENLGDALGLSAAQVRKDFSHFEMKGNRKGGYLVDQLIDRLAEVLGKEEEQRIVVVGCGKIGTALMGYNRFAREGIRVVAGFDTDPELVDPNAQVPVFHISELPEFAKRHSIRIAVMTVPEAAAPQAFEHLRKSGIRGVLNFAPTQLRETPDCVVQNVNLEQEVEMLFYFARQMEGHGTVESGPGDDDAGMNPDGRE